ncbi:MAG: transcription-repair coupling factor [Alphaproteobacteria bacterium]|nr:transcription-repair coupling factor [Alphaproteobacteria bacterium]OJV47133.1 MAG: transcription-repair coupling factor [Alphaproteobacteria bacterium 43-37]
MVNVTQIYCPSVAIMPWIEQRWLSKQSDAKCLVLADDKLVVEEWLEQVTFFCPSARVVALPETGLGFYNALSAHPSILAQRIRSLHRILSEPINIVIMSMESAFERLPLRSFLEQHTRYWKVGEAVHFGKLKESLVALGYNRVDTVRTYGEFAVRGDIVDVFSPASDLPVRMDFFGETIESAFFFDPIEQRRQSSLETVVVLPAHICLANQDSSKVFAKNCQAYFENAGDYYSYIQSLNEGVSWQGIELLFPLFFEKPCPSIFEFFQPNLVLSQSSLPLKLEQFSEKISLSRQQALKDKAPNLGAYLPEDKRFVLTMQEIDAHHQTRVEVTALKTVNVEQTDFHPLLSSQAKDQLEKLSQTESFIQKLRQHMEKQEAVLIACCSDHAVQRVKHFLSEAGIVCQDAPAHFWDIPTKMVSVVQLSLSQGFQWHGNYVYAEEDIFGTRIQRQTKTRRSAESVFKELSQVAEGDYVVHKDHGIGQYVELELIDISGSSHDCLKIMYADDDRLFLPVENIDLICRYGNVDGKVQLDKLGAASWQNRQARIKKKIQDIADKLIKIAAERKIKPGEICVPETGLFDEFCAHFPYPETDDQLNAVEDILQDLQSGMPMDRLICGDVGFGKTEVAMRAAFIVAMTGAQVAVVVPTTLLSRQHEINFKTRFEPFGLKVASLSRLKSFKEAEKVKADLKAGRVQVVIATHAIFAQNIDFSHLGLLIIDEEHHFGVVQKEKLKEKFPHVHLLSMTATPIPRTLHMALSGVREMSLIATPPVDRLAVKTYLTAFDATIIRGAIQQELDRKGQVFYISPRLEELDKILETLSEIVPEARVRIAHGQMRPAELEGVMAAFYAREFDILLATSIVESGIDLPSANTIIIHRADLFGMAQLYQLRGRVGRGQIQGHAYLLLPHYELKSKSMQRLSLLESLDTLGAGFTLASHDMDIRGVGNLVGEAQSGHIREVGVELYQSMLNDAILARQTITEKTKASSHFSPQLNLGLPIFIPQSYIFDHSLRLHLYRRAGNLKDEAAIDDFAAELKDRFGPLPSSVVNFMDILKIKVLCVVANIEKVDVGPKGVLFHLHQNIFPNPDALIEFVQNQVGLVRVRPDQRLSLIRAWPNLEQRILGIKEFVKTLASFCR